MKQYITLKQWDEITREQKNILWDSGFQKDWKMNIGQMIEFLGDDLLKIENNVEYFYVKIFEERGKRNLKECFLGKGKFEEENLCNALWKAVKYKLTN